MAADRPGESGMTRTTAPYPGGRTVTYTSDDDLYVAKVRPTAEQGYFVVLVIAYLDSKFPYPVGTFRSESEACDQARSRVKLYELEQRTE